MGNPLDSAQFQRLLDKRLSLVEDQAVKYAELRAMIPTLFNVTKSDSAWEEYFSVGTLPDVPEFTGKISYVGMSPGYHTKIEPKEYSMGVQIERKLLEDEQYGVIDAKFDKLVTSALRTKEKLGVRPFANAFSSVFDFMESEEGIALCGSHTTKSGTSTTSGFDNSGSSALSKTSVAAVRLLMRQFRNDNSERIEMSDNLALIVPDSLADLASEINGTDKGLDSAEGNKNMQYNRYSVIPYLRLDDYDTNNWFMVDLDQMKKDLLWIDRIPVETNKTIDFETYLLKLSVRFRCAYGFKDWRWIYGQAVS